MSGSNPNEIPHGIPNPSPYPNWMTPIVQFMSDRPVTDGEDYSDWLPAPPTFDVSQSSLSERLLDDGWVQIPPTVMPWGTSGGTLPTVVRFTGEKDNPTAVPFHSATLFFAKKRKSDPEVERPTKMFITEEKMADQLKNMHISNKYVTRQSESGGMDFEGGADASKEGLPMLTLSKEVQSLPTLESLLPETILSDIQRPSRALVLWKPPAGEVNDRLSLLIRTSKPEIDDNQDESANNNSSTPDLNSMSTPDYLPMGGDKADEMEFGV